MIGTVLFYLFCVTSTLALKRQSPSIKPAANNLPLKTKDAISKSDLPLYYTLAAAQVIPALAIVDLPEPLDTFRKPISYAYFITTASLAVYLGSKRQDLELIPNVISQKSAVFAPIVSSVFLFGLYLLIKFTDIEIYFDKIYQLSGTFLGVSCLDIISTSILSTVSPSTIPTTPSPTSPSSNSPLISFQGMLFGSLIASGYLLISYLGHGQAAAPYALSFFNNMIALSIALYSIGIVRVENFAVACALLTGLFFYDIFWVFGTDVMMTVATKVEAPIKFLFPAAPDLIATRSYPYSVLGLGDIVVPGVMAAFARRIDENGITPSEAAPAPPLPSVSNNRVAIIQGLLNKLQREELSTPITNEIIRKENQVSYFSSAMLGYGLGLSLAFLANEVTKAGQPALLYLVPSMIGSVVYAALKNDDLKELWGNGIQISQSKS